MEPRPARAIIKELYIFLMSWIPQPTIVYALAITVYCVLFTLLTQGSGQTDGVAFGNNFLSIYAATSLYFVFFLGARSAGKLDMMVCMGSTRKQFALVQLLSGITLSLIFSLITLGSITLSYGFAMQDASIFSYLWEFGRTFILYLTGWIVVLGLQIHRVVSTAVGILVTISVFCFSNMPFTFINGEIEKISLFYPFIPSELLLPATGVNLIIIAIFLAAILYFTRKVAIKVP